jgi:hypothetical protein
MDGRTREMASPGGCFTATMGVLDLADDSCDGASGVISVEAALLRYLCDFSSEDRSQYCLPLRAK